MRTPEIILDTEQNHVLVAVLPSPKDLALALQAGWYRIPLATAPPLIREGKATHIAFYQPLAFGEDRYTVRWYSAITSLAVRKRIEILPLEVHDPNAQKEYYVVGCAAMRQLDQPIRSKRPRRSVFFPTTLKRLFNATDINHLFNDSPLENLLWSAFIEADIPGERQFDVRIGKHWFKLDFAIFCKAMNLAIECDGDEYHMTNAGVERDKWRRNLLSAYGWQVIQLTSSKLRYEMPESLSIVREAINRYGGLQDPDSDGGFRYTHDPEDPQPRLFD
ncbi:MAG TPA: DUF559 domain-containing protein [Flavobacteriales bacterium]|nr:DUF559 domain-containing protein [Flavobacteriales bacterium]